MLVSSFTALAMMISIGTARAEMIRTPFGQADRSCVHEIPIGAHVDASTGDIKTHDNKLLAHFERCSHAWNPPALDRETAPNEPGQAFWYAFTAAHAVPAGGLTQFSQVFTNWGVPNPPNVPANDGANLFFFPGFINLSNPADITSGVSILQPVMMWGSNGKFGGHYWTIASWGVWNGGFYHSPPIQVDPGHGIEGDMYQIASNPDAWIISTTDTTTGAWTQAEIYNIPNSWPKYNWAQLGVVEAYGAPSSNIPLKSCSELPPDDELLFSLEDLWQAGPTWEDLIYADSLVSWQDFDNPMGFSPTGCQWSATQLGAPVFATVLGWYEH
jgi:hypothetical protein